MFSYFFCTEESNGAQFLLSVGKEQQWVDSFSYCYTARKVKVSASLFPDSVHSKRKWLGGLLSHHFGIIMKYNRVGVNMWPCANNMIIIASQIYTSVNFDVLNQT